MSLTGEGVNLWMEVVLLLYAYPDILWHFVFYCIQEEECDWCTKYYYKDNMYH